MKVLDGHSGVVGDQPVTELMGLMRSDGRYPSVDVEVSRLWWWNCAATPLTLTHQRPRRKVKVAE